MGKYFVEFDRILFWTKEKCISCEVLYEATLASPFSIPMLPLRATRLLPPWIVCYTFTALRWQMATQICSVEEGNKL